MEEIFLNLRENIRKELKTHLNSRLYHPGAYNQTEANQTIEKSFEVKSTDEIIAGLIPENEEFKGEYIAFNIKRFKDYELAKEDFPFEDTYQENSGISDFAGFRKLTKQNNGVEIFYLIKQNLGFANVEKILDQKVSSELSFSSWFYFFWI